MDLNRREFLAFTGSAVAVSFPALTATLTLSGVAPSGMAGTMSVGTFNTDLASNPLTLTTGTAKVAATAARTAPERRREDVRNSDIYGSQLRPHP